MATPSQDIVLGCYYLTKHRAGCPEGDKVPAFHRSATRCAGAYDHGASAAARADRGARGGQAHRHHRGPGPLQRDPAARDWASTTASMNKKTLEAPGGPLLPDCSATEQTAAVLDDLKRTRLRVRHPGRHHRSHRRHPRPGGEAGAHRQGARRKSTRSARPTATARSPTASATTRSSTPGPG